MSRDPPKGAPAERIAQLMDDARACPCSDWHELQEARRRRAINNVGSTKVKA